MFRETCCLEKNIIESYQQNIYGLLQENYRLLSDSSRIHDTETDENNIKCIEKLKSEFLSQISHEVRTPINTILSYIYLLKEQIQYNNFADVDLIFKVIDKGGQRLIRTMDSIVLMSELRSGSYFSNPTFVNLQNDVVYDVIRNYKEAASEKNLNFYLNDKTNEDILIYTDMDLIRIAVEHLVDNAIKYTGKGRIEIELDNKNGMVSLKILDTGIGIPGDYLKKIGKPFSQFEQGYTRSYEGNGLGLAIVKNICEYNNILFLARSEINKGSEFTLIMRGH